MMLSIAYSVGIDIAKDTLDIAFYPGGETFCLPNDASGHRALLKRLGGLDVLRVVFEATGAYHRKLQRVLSEAGLPLVKVNPRGARRFAEAAGKLAKTDRADAHMLARMGATLELEPRPLVTETLEIMKELISARDGLVADRVAALNRQKVAVSPLVKRQLVQRLDQIDRQIDAIDKELRALRNADDALRRRFEILTSIPGVGEVTAHVLLVETPELGRLDHAQIASLTGLAPLARDSGQWRGKRSIKGGRPRPRLALYMPALTAIRKNPDHKAKYEAMIKAGKHAKVALVAVMRKIIILANALVRQNREWALIAP
jgi:transposase